MSFPPGSALMSESLPIGCGSPSKGSRDMTAASAGCAFRAARARPWCKCPSCGGLLPSPDRPVREAGMANTHGIHTIDTGFVRPRFDAAYLVVENGRGAFIDCGTN